MGKRTVIAPHAASRWGEEAEGSVRRHTKGATNERRSSTEADNV